MVCIKCNLDKSVEDFSFRIKSKNIRHFTCKLCKRNYNKGHYKDNKELYISRAGINRKVLTKKTGDFIRNLKEMTPCKDCGNQYRYWRMQFDHLEDKKFSLAKFRYFGMETIIEEIKKCEIVCAGCHADRTQRRLENGRT